jgi:hypothetical protein
MTYYNKNGVPFITEAGLLDIQDEKKGLSTGRCSTPQKSTLTPDERIQADVRERYNTNCGGVKFR